MKKQFLVLAVVVMAAISCKRNLDGGFNPRGTNAGVAHPPRYRLDFGEGLRSPAAPRRRPWLPPVIVIVVYPTWRALAPVWRE
jgi:hypothetical protein